MDKKEPEIIQIHLTLNPQKQRDAIILKNIAAWKAKHKDVELTNAKVVRVMLIHSRGSK